MFPQSKAVVFLLTTSATNAATVTSQNLDCKGFDFVSIDLISTTSNNTSNKPSVLKLQEADDTNATSFADVAAFVGGGVGGFTIPNWHTNTATALPLKMNVDMRHRKRYLRLLVSPVTTQDFTAIANLHRGEIVPVSAADVGVLAVVAG